MRYLRLLTTCAGEIWALERSKLEAVAQFLLFKGAGGEFDQQEIEARTGGRQGGRAAPDSAGNVAIIPVYGMLAQRMNLMLDVSGGTSMQMLAADVRFALADPGTKAIILDFDSPGGTVRGTVELAQEIYNSRGVKPIIAQVNSLAASAAYWIAAAADEVVVTPSGEAGSIGVYTIHEDISKMLEKEGIKNTIIKAGRNKIDDHPYAPLSDDAAAAIQKRVDESYTAFVRGVARGRGVSMSTVNDRFGHGRMFGAEELVERGMADRVATLPETLERFGVSVHPVASAKSSARQFSDMRQSLKTMQQALKVR